MTAKFSRFPPQGKLLLEMFPTTRERLPRGTLSLDGGQIWTDLINFVPFFSFGYRGLLSIAPSRFLASDDYATPQP